MTTVTTPGALSGTWKLYQQLFTDHLESGNAAPMTIRTYGIAVQQLGDYLRAQGMPADPTAVTREPLVESGRLSGATLRLVSHGSATASARHPRSRPR